MDIKTIIKFDKDGTSLPGKLSNTKLRWSQKDGVGTCWSISSAGLKASVDLYDLVMLMKADNQAKSHAYVGTTAKGQCVAELYNNGKCHIAMATKQNDGTYTIKACDRDENGTNRECTSQHWIYLLVLMPAFLADGEAAGFFQELTRYMDIDPEDPAWDIDPANLEGFGKTLTNFTSNLYFRTRYNDTCSAGIVVSPNIDRLRQSDINKLLVTTNHSYNKPEIFAEKGTQESTKNATSGKDLKNKFSIISRTLTEQEKMLVPTMAPWYITPAWVETEAQMVQLSSMFPIPFRSLLLYGVSGTGKTEGAKAIFSALGLPAVSICCNVDMTMFDFMGQILPNVNKYGDKSVEQVSKTLGIPTFDDVENDFKGTYRTLFGTEPDEFATAGDCYSKISELMASSSTEGEPDFIYVESEFVRAYRNGWGIEIQEPTIIKRNSVLAGLNKALDNDPAAASITLPTGEIVRRHPDCMVIMTTNQDYDGCNNIQQSVLSRMQNKRQIISPDVEELVQRTVSETNFPDVDMLKTMATIIKQLGEFCNAKDVTDGVCGPRELCNWAKRAYIDAIIDTADSNPKKIAKEYVLRSAFPTIIEKVSQVAEDQKEAVIEVIQKHFAEGDVMAAEDEYLQGAA